MITLLVDRHMTHQPEVIEVIRMKLFLVTTCLWIKKKVFQIPILAWGKLGRSSRTTMQKSTPGKFLHDFMYRMCMTLAVNCEPVHLPAFLKAGFH